MTRDFRSPLLIAAFLVACATVPGCSTEEADTSAEPGPAAAPPAPGAPRDVVGMAPRANGGFGSVVMLEPEQPEEWSIPTETALMDQAGYNFHPRVLVVLAGQTVAFRNSEANEIHNVHVVDTRDGSTVFNVATPVSGTYEYVFESSGAFDVSCHIHPDMAAFIIVADTPYFGLADKEGRVVIPGVRPGSYILNVWNLIESQRIHRSIEIPEAAGELSFK